MNKGAKETVLLIHGMFSNLSVYYFNIAPILARHFHVVMYDLKSHGMSSKSKEGYDLNSLTDDLLALMETLELKAVHLVGYSFGGLIALRMAIRFPGRVKKLAVIEAPDPGENEKLGIIDMYSKEFLIDYIDNFTDTTRFKMGKRQLEKNHRMYDYLFNESSIKADLGKERSFFSGGEIGAVRQDTLLLYGKDSDCVPSGKTLYDRLTRSRIVLLDGDHNLPLQQPEATALKLKDFFEGWQHKFRQINNRIWQGLRL
jgi:pimeloyl-ACP methyl ester carboxylesterase